LRITALDVRNVDFALGQNTRCPLPSGASLKVISGGMTEMGWGTVVREQRFSLNIQQYSFQ
jgi:hypothetical protein